MALLLSRLGSRALRGSLSAPRRFYALEEFLPDPMELATGREKYQKMQKLNNNQDPFLTKPIKRLANSTKENPNEVHSFFDCRLVMCICSEDSSNLVWMWLFNGEPRRCACGHWYKLVKCKI